MTISKYQIFIILRLNFEAIMEVDNLYFINICLLNLFATHLADRLVWMAIAEP